MPPKSPAKLVNLITAAIRRNHRITAHGPAAPRQVKEVESKLRLERPDDYRAFLRHFGHLSIAHNTILGIGAPDDTGASVIHQNQALRRIRGGPRWRRSHVVIWSPGNGDEIYLATEWLRYSECPVGCWEHELDLHRLVAPSFTSWLAATFDDPHFTPPM